jgi:hypothetical protein
VAAASSANRTPLAKHVKAFGLARPEFTLSHRGSKPTGPTLKAGKVFRKPPENSQHEVTWPLRARVPEPQYLFRRNRQRLRSRCGNCSVISSRIFLSHSSAGSACARWSAILRSNAAMRCWRREPVRRSFEPHRLEGLSWSCSSASADPCSRCRSASPTLSTSLSA